jgi:hypothetical protein
MLTWRQEVPTVAPARPYRKEEPMAMEQQGETQGDEFGWARLTPDTEEGFAYKERLQVFLVQVKSDSETGAQLNNDPLTALRDRGLASEMGLDDEDVRLQVLRLNAERPQNPVRKSAVWIVYPGSTNAVAVEYKYLQGETEDRAAG